MPIYTKKGSVSGKIAMVTGAAGVLGLAVTRALLEIGLTVIMVDVCADKLEECHQMLGEMTVPLVMDLNNAQSIKEAYQSLPMDLQSVDVLVNNAGILSNNKLEETSGDEWLRVLNINLNGVFFLTKLVVPQMKRKGWGRIINTSSLAAKTGGITAGIAYSTSKGAVISLTFSLAAELASYGITVNGIAPAYVRTPMVTKQLSQSQQAELLRKIPVGRFCEPEEFAHVVTFLADDNAGFITGEIIDLNGGLHFD